MAAERLANYYSNVENVPKEQMMQILGMLLAMCQDPLAKKNGSAADYTDTLHHDTYDFIKPEQWNLEGRSVFITGASKGIGRAFASAYAKAGASYIGIGAHSALSEVEQEIQEAAKKAGRSAPKVSALKLDVTSKESVAHTAKEIEATFGRCDILVNNAGYLDQPLKMTEVDPDDWWQSFEVNVRGTFLMTRAFIPLILKHEDSLKTVANLTSMWGLTKMPGNSGYQLTKCAELRFSEICMSEYGEEGLLSYSVHPGGVNTELSEGLLPMMQKFLIDTPEMAADSIVWLTAERREWLAGRYINCAWDMKELLDKREKIVKEDQLKLRLGVGID